MIYVKDEDGLYTANPKTLDERHIHPEDLGRRDEAPVSMTPSSSSRCSISGPARHVRQVQILNGLVSGNLTRALAGEHVGTIITAS